MQGGGYLDKSHLLQFYLPIRPIEETMLYAICIKIFLGSDTGSLTLTIDEHGSASIYPHVGPIHATVNMQLASGNAGSRTSNQWQRTSRTDMVRTM